MRRPLAGLLGAVALAGALATPACHRKAAPTVAAAPRPTLGAITIENLALPRAGDDRIDAEAIERDVRQALMASGIFAAQRLASSRSAQSSR